MFRRNKPNSVKNKSNPVAKIAANGVNSVPTMIAKDFNILGNVISDGVIDFDGTINGNVRCHSLNVRKNGTVTGEIVAEDVFVYGKIKGIIRAKNVYLYASCHIEGIVMHETIAIEDGAFIDGKCKRTDKPESNGSTGFEGFEEITTGDVRILDNIKLISS
jgi:cytoskeletal protein CcmA (bactofilin family)